MFRDNREQGRTSPIPIELILAIALVARLVFGLTRGSDEAAMTRTLPDQGEYLALGRALLAGEGLRFFDPRFSEHVVAYRTAGYPVLVAACGGSVAVVRAVQALVDTSTVLAVYLLAGRWLGRRESLLAAGLVAANPLLIFFSALILTETLFTAMLAWGLWLLVAGSRGDRGWSWWCGAALLALSLHVRPSAIALPLVLGLAVVIASGVPRGLRIGRLSVPAGTSLLVLTLLVLLPWAGRNRLMTGAWVWSTTNDGFTLYDGLNPDADGSSNQDFVSRLPVLRTLGEVDRSRYLSDRAWSFATASPGRVVELAVAKVARMWSPVPLSPEYGSRLIYVAVALSYFLPFYGMVLAGLWRGSIPRSARTLMLVPAIYFTLCHALTVGSLRYRVPLEAPLAVVAASAVARPLVSRL